ncbi:MAG: hypothetical protein JWO20_2774 [Candidatus Angelobacter sp.]|jgi:hypothetical protein|nr:hypothetical protein [Candidatus Angelobacter sp.]
MRKRVRYSIVILGMLATLPTLLRGGAEQSSERAEVKPEFHTSDRCVACHNGLKTQAGNDISIGFDWRASMMANSARDPYWQGSVRRESMDHPESKAGIEDECSVCHMPIIHLQAKMDGQKAEVFSHLPFNPDNKDNAAAEDGVSCSVCHQIAKEKLGTRESFSGAFMVDRPQSEDDRPEYGPFAIDAGHKRVMQSSTGGFVPTEATHIRDSALCGSCHTLFTKTLGKDGKEIGTFNEQMPYLEWLHSDYPKRSSCQSCHMPEIHEAVAVTAILGQPRKGFHRHDFVGANFFMLRMLNNYRQDLSVAALPQELTVAADRAVNFLQSQAARVTIRDVESSSAGLRFQVFVENLSGHKLPTAYPSRRAWLHIRIRDNSGQTVFESGALNADGSIAGNDNDADPLRFEPHYREITSPEQVEIYEPIMKDSANRVTTGLLSAVGYLKDNRILPTGFNKQTAENDIAVIGDAAEDPDFNDKGSLVRYSVPTVAAGPFHIEAELWYQPIGFRWAHNLGPYNAAEPQRFVGYYKSMSSATAVVLAKAEATR